MKLTTEAGFGTSLLEGRDEQSDEKGTDHRHLGKCWVLLSGQGYSVSCTQGSACMAACAQMCKYSGVAAGGGFKINL